MRQINKKAPGASNSWVIHGNHTKSGKPIFANDPHLEPMIPTHFYLIELRVGDQFLIGGTNPGILFFPTGRNNHMAWGPTNSNLDKADIYEETIKGDKYLFKGEWKDLEI